MPAPQPESSTDDPSTDRDPDRRRDRRVAFSAWVGWLLLEFYAHTCRYRVVSGMEHLAALRGANDPLIFATWHESLFLVAPFLARKVHRRGKPLIALISRSEDGDVGDKVLKRWGIQTVRGSSSSGGMAAVRQLARESRSQGLSPVLIPDGPRGPARQAAPGVVMLSQLTDLSIVAITASASSSSRLSSWDRTWVPWPFSQIGIGFELLDRETLTSAGERDCQLQLVQEQLDQPPKPSRRK